MGEPVIIDARGLTCPLPILRAKKGLRLVEIGGRITVLATDPSSRNDFDGFCRETGNVLEESVQEGEVFRYVIRRCR